MDKKEILEILKAPWQESAPLTSRILAEHKGAHVHVRGIIEFSNICKRNCLYCGLRAQNRQLARYCLTQEEILAVAQTAVASGVDTIVLQSGEGSAQAAWLAEVVREISRFLPVTLSVGEASEQDYSLWAKAGARRYLIKHETADPALYRKLHPGHDLGERLRALRTLRELGYEIGSGFMIGLPGQSLDSLAEDILLLEDMHIDMAGAGPFIPQAQTPLSHCDKGSAELCLRVIAAMRVALPWANLPATTALATIDPENGQKNGLLAGANVLMPSFTPLGHAGNYKIYDSKNRISVKDAARAIEGAGRKHALQC